MSTFLHDAVLLYGLAYNSSLALGNDTSKANISYDQFRDPNSLYEGMYRTLVYKCSRKVTCEYGLRVSDYFNQNQTVEHFHAAYRLARNHTYLTR